MLNDDRDVCLLELEPMAKSRSKAEEPPDEVRTLFAVKGRGSWYAWLKEYGAVLNRDAMGAIDHALREQSKREGFREMPKRVR